MDTKEISGFLPGEYCEERVQWIFEGDWSEEEMQPLLHIIQADIRRTREKYGFDVTNYWRFYYHYGENGEPRWYQATRCQWRFSLDSWTIKGLVTRLQKNIDERNNWIVGENEDE